MQKTRIAQTHGGSFGPGKIHAVRWAKIPKRQGRWAPICRKFDGVFLPYYFYDPVDVELTDLTERVNCKVCLRKLSAES